MKDKGEERIYEILEKFISTPGRKKDVIPGVDIFRIEKMMKRAPFNYDQSIVILFQGKKRVYMGEKTIVYDSMNYLVLSVPLPIECDVISSRKKPIIGISIKINASIIGKIVLEADINYDIDHPITPGIYSENIDERLLDAIYRLVCTLKSEMDKKVLAPIYVHEIIYRVLISKNCELLKMFACQDKAFYKIAEILEEIHEDYQKKYDVNSMAKQVNMSVSAFYYAFKKITYLSPIQYVKKIKLHKARELILQHGFNISSAAFKVGYESTSQFAREYKRMFGRTPSSEIG